MSFRKTIVPLIVLVVYVAVSNSTRVSQCNSNGKFYEDEKFVTISACDAPPCTLKRNTKIVVEIRFTPKTKVDSLDTSVHAEVLGVQLPFIGVNGVTACDRLFNADGSQASCPLEAGKEYVYKNGFPVLSIYPKIRTIVHWALVDGQGVKKLCFEISARIV